MLCLASRCQTHAEHHSVLEVIDVIDHEQTTPPALSQIHLFGQVSYTPQTCDSPHTNYTKSSICILSPICQIENTHNFLVLAFGTSPGADSSCLAALANRLIVGWTNPFAFTHGFEDQGRESQECKLAEQHSGRLGWNLVVVKAFVVWDERCSFGFARTEKNRRIYTFMSGILCNCKLSRIRTVDRTSMPCETT